ncbi:PTS sugar transporter subunit IIA [Globicatella sanguinis]
MRDIIKYDLFAVCDGRLIDVTEVSDFAFSSKMMGNGFAFIPESGLINSPIDGIVSEVFPTKHVIGIQNKPLELLVHIGINTVDLNGEPFINKVSVGQKVNHDTLISEVDLKMINKKSNISSEIIILFLDQVNIKSLQINNFGAVARGQNIGTIEIYNS